MKQHTLTLFKDAYSIFEGFLRKILQNTGWGRQPEDKTDAEGQKQSKPATDNNKSDKPSAPPPKPPKKDDEPPELEEIWRDFNKKLGDLFGNKPKRPSSEDLGPKKNNQGNYEPPKNNTTKHSALNMPNGGKALIGTLLSVFVLIWLATGFYTVQEGQVAVVTEFGKYDSTSGAGLHWRLPYPIQDTITVDISKVRKVEVGTKNKNGAQRLKEALMLTDDENIVDVQFEVQYRLRENGAPGYLFSSEKPDDAVMQAAESAMREEVGKRSIDEVLNVGRLEISQAVEKRIQSILDRYKIRRVDVDKEEYFDSGILITAVAIQNAQPPEQVQAAFDDAVKAVQDKERQINEGQAYANDVVPRAKGAASRLISEAEGYKQRVMQTAEGDASRFKSIVTEYAKAPAVTRQRMYIETMQKVFESTSKVMVDTRHNNSMLYLPLDKIIAQTTAESARVAAEQNGVNNSVTLSNPTQILKESLTKDSVTKSKDLRDLRESR